MSARVLVVVSFCLLVGAGAAGAAGADASSRTSAVEVYRTECAVCHGETGRGDGPAAVMLSPPPHDFTTGRYKFRSTPTGTLPREGDVARTIADGLRGTSMPAFRDRLSDEEIRGVARLVLSMASVAPRFPADGGDDAPPGSVEGRHDRADIVARGAALFRDADCDRCHDAEGRSLAVSGTPRPGAPTPPPDLAEPWTFRRQGDGEVAQRVLRGIDGTAMPSYAGSLSPDDAAAIERFVATLAREPIWRSGDARLVAAAGTHVDPVSRGRYLVKAMMCPLCHTPISAETGAYDATRFLAGGMRVSAYPWGVWYSRNLTPDGETGLGHWTPDEIVRAITTGVSRDGRRLDPMAMPWPWFSRLTVDDARAIAAFLTRLPPVDNRVPPPEGAGIAERVGGKVLAILGSDVAVEFAGGNAARDPRLRGVHAGTGRRVVSTAIGVVTLALPLAGVLVAARRRRVRAGAACVLAIVGWAVAAAWPPLALLDPATTTRWLFLGSPRPRTVVDPAAAALVRRGEYLVTIAPCGLCHTPASPFAGFLTGRWLAGGMQARWRVYGTAVATNLTPHPRDGLRDDQRMVRALESGLARDGRRMHWQAMPWDLLSNWSEEDQRAMIAYLRALPAVAGRVPPPEPPRPDDPDTDAFFFGDRAQR